MDNLDRCMIQCKADGFGVRYGSWRAANGEPLTVKDEGVPEGWRVCEYCDTVFKPSSKRLQKFCGAYCQNRASYERCKQKKKEGAENGSNL